MRPGDWSVLALDCLLAAFLFSGTCAARTCSSSTFCLHLNVTAAHPGGLRFLTRMIDAGPGKILW